MPAKREIDWATLATRQRAVSESVAAHIQRWIQDGSLEPGMRLPPERELAGLLGISRASLRQALHELTLKGLLTRRPGVGTVVLAPGAQVDDLVGAFDREERRVREISDFRLVFEPQIVERAAFRHTPADLAVLEELCGVEHATMSSRDSAENDERFHVALARATHNALLVTLAETTANWLREARMTTHARPAAREASWREHLDLLAAVRRRDGGLARRLMQEHVESATRQMTAAAAGA